MATVEILVLRPLMLLGAPRGQGSTFNVAPLVASALVASGRAQLVHAADRAALDLAENEHSLHACRVESSRRFRN